MAFEFHQHYRLLPLDLADQWHDLKVGHHLPKELQLNEKEKSEKGLKRYFVAHFFLWAYPKKCIYALLTIQWSLQQVLPR
jgi:hypothetical protein